MKDMPTLGVQAVRPVLSAVAVTMSAVAMLITMLILVMLVLVMLVPVIFRISFYIDAPISFNIVGPP